MQHVIVGIQSNGQARFKGAAKRRRPARLAGSWQFFSPNYGMASDPTGAHCLLTEAWGSRLCTVWSVLAAAPVARLERLSNGFLVSQSWLPGPSSRLFCYTPGVSLHQPGHAKAAQARLLTPGLEVLAESALPGGDQARCMAVSSCGSVLAVIDSSHQLFALSTADCSTLACVDLGTALAEADVDFRKLGLHFSPDSSQLLVSALSISLMQQALLVDLSSQQTWRRLLAPDELPSDCWILGWGRQAWLCAECVITRLDANGVHYRPMLIWPVAGELHRAGRLIEAVADLQCSPCLSTRAPVVLSSPDCSFVAVATTTAEEPARDDSAWRVTVVRCSTGKLAAEWCTPPRSQGLRLALRWAQHGNRLECKLSSTGLYGGLATMFNWHVVVDCS